MKQAAVVAARVRFPRLVALNVGVFIGVFAASARADGWWIEGGSGYLVPGYIHSETWGNEPASGNGLELTYDYYPKDGGPGWPGTGVGVLTQWERYQSPGHDRFAIGAQLVSPLAGLELAYAHRGGTGARRSTHGLHIAPFVSLGVFSLALRGTLPVAPAEQSYGLELGFTLGVKLPLLLHGEGFNLSFPHGRPLTVDQRAVVAALAPRSGAPGWSGAGELPELACAAERLSADERAAVADHWLRAALEEHASIASFSRLSLELLSLGAPPHFVEQAHRAALDELQHARSCLAIGHALRSDLPDVGMFPEATRAVRDVTMAELAAAAFREGCMGERRAAEALRRAAREAVCGELSQTLFALADDEGRHAEFAWQLLAWCHQRDPAAVSRAVDRALAAELGSVPRARPALPPGFGQLSPSRERQLWRAVARHARLRWRSTTAAAAAS